MQGRGRRAAALGVVVGTALALTGCGGDAGAEEAGGASAEGSGGLGGASAGGSGGAGGIGGIGSEVGACGSPVGKAPPATVRL